MFLFFYVYDYFYLFTYVSIRLLICLFFCKSSTIYTTFSSPRNPAKHTYYCVNKMSQIIKAVRVLSGLLLYWSENVFCFP